MVEVAEDDDKIDMMYELVQRMKRRTIPNAYDEYRKGRKNGGYTRLASNLAKKSAEPYVKSVCKMKNVRGDAPIERIKDRNDNSSNNDSQRPNPLDLEAQTQAILNGHEGIHRHFEKHGCPPESAGLGEILDSVGKSIANQTSSELEKQQHRRRQTGNESSYPDMSDVNGLQEHDANIRGGSHVPPDLDLDERIRRSCVSPKVRAEVPRKSISDHQSGRTGMEGAEFAAYLYEEALRRLAKLFPNVYVRIQSNLDVWVALAIDPEVDNITQSHAIRVTGTDKSTFSSDLAVLRKVMQDIINEQ